MDYATDYVAKNGVQATLEKAEILHRKAIAYNDSEKGLQAVMLVCAARAELAKEAERAIAA